MRILLSWKVRKAESESVSALDFGYRRASEFLCFKLTFSVSDFLTVGFCIETPWRWGVFLWYNCGVTDWRIYEVL